MVHHQVPSTRFYAVAMTVLEESVLMKELVLCYLDSHLLPMDHLLARFTVGRAACVALVFVSLPRFLFQREQFTTDCKNMTVALYSTSAQHRSNFWSSQYSILGFSVERTSASIVFSLSPNLMSVLNVFPECQNMRPSYCSVSFV